ncbi:hypothetical protein SAMD00019534_089650 [Acytostelium subglobosum LB1]|uniref:hypothetical protein n=1 Tax=Acytostelium subglobosum LB1 TaxID=1410327 RepID=UPI000645228F|nr:hypothetical protein SAMD00019534_089650 [Acytostelium subglobosum LB1]GAM25790.1 hypothetical protein SAMD00019534_089650 [Acytostelium subglobosum LB1]|eukprot:XP_012751308.1 hypothetical protein SAMD00019534_089650 [Acytostelium subglobosum LB1]
MQEQTDTVTTTTTTPQYTLRQATDDEFKQNTFDSYPQWGKPLTPEQYWGREVVSKAVVTNHRPWVLLYDGKTVSSCETYGENSAYCYIDDDQFTMHRGRSESVASVFVSEKYRGKGYASIMMNMLREQCQREGAIFVDLYSDINPQFYAKCGWTEYSRQSVIIDLSQYPATATATATDRTDITMIDSSNYVPIVHMEIEKTTLVFKERWQHFRQQLNQQQHPDNNAADGIPTHLFGKLLTPERVAWHMSQVQLYSQSLQIQPVPTCFGVKINATDSSMFWFQDFRDRELYIFHLTAANKEDFKTMIDLAVAEARKYGFNEVKFWYNDSDKIKPEYLEHIGQKIVIRDGSVPMAVDWIPPNAPSISGKGMFINIEKFVWV